ncbi:C40 family peptidase [Hymenobacter sp. BT664]|uniref:C40 family peptidase n=1 Tax=Hymenobacter montanus TaxID=2771359 RepID=A0A927GJE4_9BACT|nr:C40 family peptidase [Hymenobacter montanus]
MPRLNRPASLSRRTAGTSTQPTAAPARSISAGAALRGDVQAPGGPTRSDSVVAFGLAQRGTPYAYAGSSPLTGFDCSGFIRYTFARFRIAVPHSTALLIGVGRPVARHEAQPGDIVVFTGTDTTSTTPGHAGIVVSDRGEVPLRFVHASSARREPGVKVSQVEGTDYERRFMQVRRVLEPDPNTTP